MSRIAHLRATLQTLDEFIELGKTDPNKFMEILTPVRVAYPSPLKEMRAAVLTQLYEAALYEGQAAIYDRERVDQIMAAENKRATNGT